MGRSKGGEVMSNYTESFENRVYRVINEELPEHPGDSEFKRIACGLMQQMAQEITKLESKVEFLENRVFGAEDY